MTEAKERKANLVRLLIAKGWNPPRPNTQQLTHLLQDMEDVQENATLGLSPKQLALVRMSSEGMTRPDSAEALGVSVETVKTYWSRIMERLGAKNQAHAVAIALREGIIE